MTSELKNKNKVGFDMRYILLNLIFFTLAGCASVPQAHAGSTPKNCQNDSAQQTLRSQELQKLAKADQDDRLSGPMNSIDWSQVSVRDENRRKRVGEIFGEGCFKTAEDYSAAALIYQHGTVPDHYFQAFLWSKKAFDLNPNSKKWDIAAGIDRYLVHSGQKQLFGTQFSQNSNKQWCIEPIEPTFPEARRTEYLGRSLQESIRVFLEFYRSSQAPQDVHDCVRSFKPSPSGTVPGFW